MKKHKRTSTKTDKLTKAQQLLENRKARNRLSNFTGKMMSYILLSLAQWKEYTAIHKFISSKKWTEETCFVKVKRRPLT